MERKGHGAAGCLLGIACFLLAGGAAAAPPDRTILHHGKVFTSDPDRLWAEAIAIQGDRVQAAGSEAEVMALATPRTRVVDLGGRTVIPGLNDAHVHVLGVPGVRLNDPSFVPGPGPTLSEVLDLIQAGAAANPPGTWLVVTVGPNVSEDPNAQRFVLDEVSPDHPVRLEAWSGHGTYLNTKAMEALGIAEDEPDPFGGHYTRFPGSNVITGEAHEYAEHLIRRAMYQLLPVSDAAAQYQAYAAQAVVFGFTSIQDMAFGLTKGDALATLAAADLPIRVRSICTPLTPGESCDGDGGGMVRSSGIKWVTDGTPIERLAFVETPYADEPGWVGAFNFPAAPFQAMLERGLMGSPRTHQLLFHSVGDGAIDEVLDAMEATGGAAVWNGRRTRIEHGDLLFSPNFDRMRDLGAVIVQNPRHLALTGLFAQRFTPAVFGELEPLRTLLDRDIPLALGTDGIGGVLDPWVDVFLAALHPTHPSEALSVEQAVIAYTRGSAYAEFEEHRKGTLAPGKYADLAVLSQDPFTVPVFAVPATTSVLTIVGGRVVWDAGAL
jgi:hypothetical protein